MDHELAFVKAFIASEKQARWAQFLSNPKRRKEILNQLNHNLPFDQSKGTEVPGHQDFPAEIERLLRAKGAGPTCHLIVDESRCDGKVLPLTQALTELCLHEFGGIISCIPGRLAYYKPESPHHGIILEQPSR